MDGDLKILSLADLGSVHARVAKLSALLSIV